jgi:hypothetical protein
MSAIITYDLADEQFEKPFRVYANYFEELAGIIGGRFGMTESLVVGVQDVMRQHPPLRQVRKRSLDRRSSAELEAALRKSWSFLGRVGREVEEDDYDEEANAWLPEQAYYAVHHAMRAVIIAARGYAPKEHRRVLNVISREAVDGRFVFPWNVYCVGCPQYDQERVARLTPAGTINPLQRPDPDTADTRIALMLKTTRERELDRRFADARHKGVQPGRTRRNISKPQKIKMAENLAATTLFDFFYRTRAKAHYDEPDAFVLGASGTQDARRLGESMAIVTDATLAALECLVATYVSRGLVARAALNYADRKNAGAETLVGRRAHAWAGVVPAEIT